MTQDPSKHGGYRITRKTVELHNCPNDGWVILDNSVYDVTMFIEKHPGGAEILVKHLGKDVSETMRSNPHQHSKVAFQMLDKYHIGYLTDKPGEVARNPNIDPKTGTPLVDWKKPILPQVGAMGDKYQEWVHSFPTSDHSVQLFPNEFIESFTKCPWYYPLVFWLPIFVVLTWYYIIPGNTLFTFIPLFLIGYFSWLSFEYSLHRFIFHMNTKNYFMNIIHFLIHGQHHITPMDCNRLVFPPIPAVLVSSPVLITMPYLLGKSYGCAFLLGFGVGYLAYDMTHYWIHHSVPSWSFLKNQKTRHIHHHYFQPDVNFGISNPLIDIICGTLCKSKEL